MNHWFLILKPCLNHEIRPTSNWCDNIIYIKSTLFYIQKNCQIVDFSPNLAMKVKQLCVRPLRVAQHPDWTSQGSLGRNNGTLHMAKGGWDEWKIVCNWDTIAIIISLREFREFRHGRMIIKIQRNWIASEVSMMLNKIAVPCIRISSWDFMPSMMLDRIVVLCFSRLHKICF